MITINNKKYSGNVVTVSDESLAVMIHTSDSFQDVLANTLSVNQVTDSETNSVFNVTESLPERSLPCKEITSFNISLDR